MPKRGIVASLDAIKEKTYQNYALCLIESKNFKQFKKGIDHIMRSLFFNIRNDAEDIAKCVSLFQAIYIHTNLLIKFKTTRRLQRKCKRILKFIKKKLTKTELQQAEDKLQQRKAEEARKMEEEDKKLTKVRIIAKYADYLSSQDREEDRKKLMTLIEEYPKLTPGQIRDFVFQGTKPCFVDRKGPTFSKTGHSAYSEPKQQNMNFIAWVQREKIQKN